MASYSRVNGVEMHANPQYLTTVLKGELGFSGFVISEAADGAGWDTNLLLPHQELLSLGIKGAVLLSVVLSVVTFLSLLRSRPLRTEQAVPQAG